MTDTRQPTAVQPRRFFSHRHWRNTVLASLLWVLALATVSCTENTAVENKAVENIAENTTEDIAESTTKPSTKKIPSLDPTRYDDAISSFLYKDTIFPPAKGGIVMVGSSSFALWNQQMPQDLAPLDVIPRGFGGSTLRDVLHFADKIITPYQPRALVVYEGDNDISSYGVTPEEMRDDYLTLFEILQQANAGARLYVVSIKPSISRTQFWPQQKAANRLLKTLCDRNPLMTYIDTASVMFDQEGVLNQSLFVEDGVHMNGQGYRLWREVIRGVLMEYEAGFIP